jgi:hypothetical protein
MNAPSRTELQKVMGATANGSQDEYVVQWQSAFGTIVIEVRGEDIYVNGDKVEHAKSSATGET